jgi:hypothetical protein
MSFPPYLYFPGLSYPHQSPIAPAPADPPPVYPNPLDATPTQYTANPNPFAAHSPRPRNANPDLFITSFSHSVTSTMQHRDELIGAILARHTAIVYITELHIRIATPPERTANYPFLNARTSDRARGVVAPSQYEREALSNVMRFNNDLHYVSPTDSVLVPRQSDCCTYAYNMRVISFSLTNFFNACISPGDYAAGLTCYFCNSWLPVILLHPRMHNIPHDWFNGPSFESRGHFPLNPTPRFLHELRTLARLLLHRRGGLKAWVTLSFWESRIKLCPFHSRTHNLMRNLFYRYKLHAALRLSRAAAATQRITRQIAHQHMIPFFIRPLLSFLPIRRGVWLWLPFGQMVVNSPVLLVVPFAQGRRGHHSGPRYGTIIRNIPGRTSNLRDRHHGVRILNIPRPILIRYPPAPISTPPHMLQEFYYSGPLGQLYPDESDSGSDNPPPLVPASPSSSSPEVD